MDVIAQLDLVQLKDGYWLVVLLHDGMSNDHS